MLRGDAALLILVGDATHIEALLPAHREGHEPVASREADEAAGVFRPLCRAGDRDDLPRHDEGAEERLSPGWRRDPESHYNPRMRRKGKPRKAGKCEGCGARVRTEGGFCQYCGAELPGREPPKPAAPSRFGDLEERFAELRKHPNTPRLMQRTPSTSGALGTMVVGLVVGIFFAGFAIFFISTSRSFDRKFEESRRNFGVNFPEHLRPPGENPAFPPDSGPDFDMFLLIPGLFVCIGAGIAIWSLVKIARFTNAPLERRPALVVGERTRVSGGGQNSSASTSYFVSFEFEHGRRREYMTRGRIVGEVTEGDIGIAYLKGDRLLDFARVPV